MNSCKIAYDGRVTFWNAKSISPKSPKAPILRQSPEWELFLSLPTEAKEEFLASGLGSSHDINSDLPPERATRAARGTSGITSYGRSLIRMGCQYLEDRYGVKHLSFLTCTLPPSVLAEYTRETWAEVVHRFLKQLRGHLERAKLCSQIVGCIEVQETRLRRDGGLPPLHLHLVFQGRGIGKPWAYPPEFYQAVWERACLSVWGGSHQFQASSRVEPIYTSSVSYMGKYMSKGGGVLKLISPENLPSGWYTISKKLKAFVKSQEFRCSGELAHALYEYFYSGDMLLWARSAWSDWTETGTRYLVAWIGAIRSRSTYWEVVEDARNFISTRNIPLLTGML